MSESNTFTSIFGEREGRSTQANHLFIRDANFIADLKDRISLHAAADSRARGSDWRVDFSPTQTDHLTERSLFGATLTSASEGERYLPFVIASDWVEIGNGAMESSVRSIAANLEMALENAFRRVVLCLKSNMADPNAAVRADVNPETPSVSVKTTHPEDAHEVVERRFSNIFLKSEEAHEFEQHVTGSALKSGLSVGPSKVEDMGLPGCAARITLSGERTTLSHFADDLHQGIRLNPDD